MSLFPGKTNGLGGYALEDSLALAMEEELEALYPQIKHLPMPAQGREDRRLLFVAIARGILRYLKAHEEAVTTEESDGDDHHHQVTFEVTMDGHDPH